MGKRLSTDSTMNHFRGHNELILQELFEKSLTNYHDLCYIRICSTILCYESTTKKALGCLALVNVGHVYLLIAFNGIDMSEVRSQIRPATTALRFSPKLKQELV